MRLSGLALILLAMLQASVLTTLVFFLRDFSEIKSRLAVIEANSRANGALSNDVVRYRERNTDDEKQKNPFPNRPAKPIVRAQKDMTDRSAQPPKTGNTAPEQRKEDIAPVPPDPNTLSSAWVLPHPPENRGRFIHFESFRPRVGADGRELLLFKEWNGKQFRETAVPSSEVRWDVREP